MVYRHVKLLRLSLYGGWDAHGCCVEATYVTNIYGFL